MNERSEPARLQVLSTYLSDFQLFLLWTPSHFPNHPHFLTRMFFLPASQQQRTAIYRVEANHEFNDCDNQNLNILGWMSALNLPGCKWFPRWFQVIFLWTPISWTTHIFPPVWLLRTSLLGTLGRPLRVLESTHHWRNISGPSDFSLLFSYEIKTQMVNSITRINGVPKVLPLVSGVSK